MTGKTGPGRASTLICIYRDITTADPEGGQVKNTNRTDSMILTHANGNSTTNAICIYRKVCKNPRSLKIHQARMKCTEWENILQCTGSDPDEMQEEPDQNLK